MSQYPALTAGPLSVATLQSMVPDVTLKASTTDRVSTTTLANDLDLVAIPLGVGTWSVEMGIFVATATTNTQDFKTQWSFTGTWSTPIRFCLGPGPTNTALRDAITPMQLNGIPSNSDAVYGLGASTGFTLVLEWCKSVVVTVAGTLALQWAQNASSANSTSVKQGSYVEIRQVA